MTMQLFENLKKKTHMPFAFEGGLLCVAADENDTLVGKSGYPFTPWRLAWSPDLVTLMPIDTGLPTGSCECSPYAFRDGDGKIIVEWFGGVPDAEGRLIYHRYRMTGDDWSHLAAPVQMDDRPRMIGFNAPEFRAEATPRGIELLNKRDGTTAILKDGLGAVCRLSYDAAAPNRLLLTGVYQGRTASFIHDLSTGRTLRVRCDGKDVYKFTCLPNGGIVHAVKGTGEDRRLCVDTPTLEDQDVPAIAADHPEPAQLDAAVAAARHTLLATPHPTKAPIRKPCGCGGKQSAAARVTPVTRPSCLECVEKHLGAAWVLLAEQRDGYPHRLRAVGHLHEAEDESQAWPELHDAIREARKAFQREGKMPDFPAISMHLKGSAATPVIPIK